jgi:hypothetical protein
LHEQLFGRTSTNSKLAAELFVKDRAVYDAAKQKAIEAGYLPTATVPKCLQDEPETT